jgi:hypothetical protein
LSNARTVRETQTEKSLEDAVHETLPRGPGGDLGTLLVDVVPVEFTTASVNVHLSGAEPSLTLPEVSGNPESSNDEDGEVCLEEVFGSTKRLADRRDSSVELMLF